MTRIYSILLVTLFTVFQQGLVWGAPPERLLEVTVSGDGSITSGPDDPIGIDCPGTICGGLYPQGTTVTLTAKPMSGSAFQNWTGDCTGTQPSCTVKMDYPRTVGSMFDSAVDRDGK